MLHNLKHAANISNQSIFPLPLYSQHISIGQIKAFCKCSAECTGGTWRVNSVGRGGDSKPKEEGDIKTPKASWARVWLCLCWTKDSKRQKGTRTHTHTNTLVLNCGVVCYLTARFYAEGVCVWILLRKSGSYTLRRTELTWVSQRRNFGSLSHWRWAYSELHFIPEDTLAFGEDDSTLRNAPERNNVPKPQVLY